MAYGDFKDLNRTTSTDKVLRNKAFNVAKNLKHDGYQRGLALIVYKFLDKKSSGGAVKNEIISNEELVEELYKAIIKKFEKRKVYSHLIDNIWGTDLAKIITEN